MSINFENSKLKINECKDVIVSEIEEDEDNGVWVRLISIYTDPTSVINRRPILEIVITDTDKASLEVTTPNLNF